MAKLPMRTKLIYGAGDIYGGGIFNIINLFYTIFLTDVCAIPAYWAGIIMLAGRVWDAVSDPMMGVITDNTRSRMGRRRPYLLAGVPLVFVSFVLVWYPPAFAGVGMRVAYAMAAYLFLDTVTTLVMVPYGALGCELTFDYAERSGLAAVKLAFSLGSTLLCAILPSMIIKSFPDIRTGYIAMSVTFGLLFALPWLLTFFGLRENPDFMSAPKATLKESVRTLIACFRVKSFVRLVIMYLGMFVTLDLISVMFSYYMKYAVNQYAHLTFVLGTLVISQIACLPLALALSKRFGKARVFAWGCIAWAALCLATLLLNPGTHVAMIYLLAFGLGGSMAFPNSTVQSVYGDVADAGELILGKRYEGSFSGVQTFVRKCASAIAIALAMFILGAFGYVESAGGAVVAQPQSVISAIRFILAFMPLPFLIVGILAANTWALTPARHKQLIRFLELLRAGRKADPELERAVDEMRPLI